MDRLLLLLFAEVGWLPWPGELGALLSAVSSLGRALLRRELWWLLLEPARLLEDELELRPERLRRLASSFS
jgi:hypothetical protein